MFELWNEAIFGKEDWQPEVDEQRIRVDSRIPTSAPRRVRFRYPHHPRARGRVDPVRSAIDGHDV